MTLPLPQLLRAALLSLALAALAACAAPAPTPAGGEPAQAAGAKDAAPPPAPAATAPETAPTPAPDAKPPATHTRRTGGPLPPERVDDRAPAEVKVDTSCRTDADCAVKDVGNCCGHYPACVNVNSPTDPKGVQARCAKQGMASVCGFQEIRSCACVKGSCEAADSGAIEVDR
jgi:hypothetical protein